jgi:hypothetical protein
MWPKSSWPKADGVQNGIHFGVDSAKDESDGVESSGGLGDVDQMDAT